MNSRRARIRPTWPGWLVWALPASIGSDSHGLPDPYQAALIRHVRRHLLGESSSSVIGPLAAWLLLRQLALDADASRAAAVRIESLAAEERHRRSEMTALYVVSAAMNQALSEEDALSERAANGCWMCSTWPVAESMF